MIISAKSPDSAQFILYTAEIIGPTGYSMCASSFGQNSLNKNTLYNHLRVI